MAKLLCESNQTIFDVALKKNGNIENIFMLMAELGVVNINEALDNRIFDTQFQTTNAFVKTLFMSNTNLVSGATYTDELDDLNAGAFDQGFDIGFDIKTEPSLGLPLTLDFIL